MTSGRDILDICRDGDIDAVYSMIKNIEFDNYYSNWGLKGACEGGHLNIVNLMIEYGASDWNWGLKWACKGGNLDIVELMIEHGAKNWNDGLYSACEYGHLDVIRLLIEKGANNFNRGLAYACRGGHLDVINMMIEYGARNWDWGLDEACQYRHLDIVKLMIEKGAYDLNPIFELIFDMDDSDIIDSDIVNLMIKKEILMENHLGYPEDKMKIYKLHELGMPIDNFKYISGFDRLMDKIKERQNTVKHVLSDYLINDLIEITNGYVTW